MDLPHSSFYLREKRTGSRLRRHPDSSRRKDGSNCLDEQSAVHPQDASKAGCQAGGTLATTTNGTAQQYLIQLDEFAM